MIRIVTAEYLAQLRECIKLHEELRAIQAISIATQKSTIEILQGMVAKQCETIINQELHIAFLTTQNEIHG